MFVKGTIPRIFWWVAPVKFVGGVAHFIVISKASNSLMEYSFYSHVYSQFPHPLIFYPPNIRQNQRLRLNLKYMRLKWNLFSFQVSMVTFFSSRNFLICNVIFLWNQRFLFLGFRFSLNPHSLQIPFSFSFRVQSKPRTDLESSTRHPERALFLRRRFLLVGHSDFPHSPKQTCLELWLFSTLTRPLWMSTATTGSSTSWVSQICSTNSFPQCLGTLSW